jgi:hypothetical protein
MSRSFGAAQMADGHVRILQFVGWRQAVDPKLVNED